MSQRIKKGWIVLDSIEAFDGDRCVDLFRREDGTFGFEEFRRDPEDAGLWTAMRFCSAVSYGTQDAALAAAMKSVAWLGEALGKRRGSR